MADRFEARMKDLVSILALEKNGKIVGESHVEVSMAPSSSASTRLSR